jgi:hypothetical protein
MTAVGALLALPMANGLARGDEVSFRNEVMPVLSKAGCNAGTCHGNANGKAGFKLSLRGESPELDFLALTRDQFARRVNPMEPEQSLILLKATTQLTHEGGSRFKSDSREYETLRRWISEGSRPDAPGAPILERIDVTPQEQILVEPARQVQLKVRAEFSDGTKRDVTRVAVYDPANALANVSHDGLVSREGTGETTILVRYLNAQVPVRLAFVPARPDFVWKKTPANNYIDEHIFTKLRSLRMNASGLCTDTEFVRRAHLDLLGILPTADEARAFVRDSRRDKRARLIDALLKREEFADFWALKWSDLLRAEEKVLDRKGVQNFHHWIRQSLAGNKPLDQFVREIISARGSSYSDPAANYLRAIRTPVARAESTAQLFLGVRLQCAQCHNHPFDRWTQDDYYSWAGVFSRVDYKILQNNRRDNLDSHEFIGEQIVFPARDGGMTNARTRKLAQPKFLGAALPASGRESQIPNSKFQIPEADSLESLALWLTSPTNTLFARSQVNRIWYHLMGRGIVDPIDDFRPTNPPSHPALLDALAQDFVRHKFDLRHLIRLIMNSRAYQLSAEPNATNGGDEVNYSHVLPRRLTAEQMIDAQHQVAGVPARFNGYPSGLRASQLPGLASANRRDAKAVNTENLLKLFGKPNRILTCECERSSETTMGQAFQLISGPAINQLLAQSDNRLAKMLATDMTSAEIVEELYWTALSRAPTERELKDTVAFLDKSKDRRLALEDVAWALLNVKEFVLRK